MAETDVSPGGIIQQLFSGALGGLPGALQAYKSGVEQSNAQMGDTLRGGIDYLQNPNRDGVNLPLLMASGAMMAPTRTGSFSESLGNAFGTYGGALQQARGQDMDRQMKLLKLQEAQANLTRDMGGTQLGLIEKSLGIVPQISAGVGVMADMTPVQSMASPVGIPPQVSGAGRLPPVAGVDFDASASPARTGALGLPQAKNVLQDYIANPDAYRSDPAKMAQVEAAWNTASNQIADSVGTPPVNSDPSGVVRWAENIRANVSKNPSLLMGKKWQELNKQAIEIIEKSPANEGAKAAAKSAAEMTTDEKNYRVAVRQGYDKDFNTWLLDVKKSGATQVNVGKAEETEDVERSKAMVKRFSDIAAGGADAKKDLIVVRRLGELFENVEPGAKEAALERIRQSTGIALSKNAGNVQAAQAMVDYMIPRMRVEGSGATSDRDAAGFRNSLPSILGTKDGNKKVVQTLSGMAEHNSRMADIATQYQLKKITAAEAQRRIDELPDPFAPVRDIIGKPTDPVSEPSTAPVLKPGDVMDGYRYKGGDKSKPGSWEKVQ